MKFTYRSQEKDIMIAEQICTPVRVISFCSSNTAAQSPEMKVWGKVYQTNSAPWTDSLCTYLGGIYMQTK